MRSMASCIRMLMGLVGDWPVASLNSNSAATRRAGAEGGERQGRRGGGGKQRVRRGRPFDVVVMVFLSWSALCGALASAL